MDMLTFLQQGNVRPNPEYNPKTKKGKYQSPTLVDYNPGTSISDVGTSQISRVASRNLYSLNDEDVNKYAKYDVYASPAYTEEELNRERAENQTAIEQSLRSVGQALVNEVAIGTVLGFSNLFDAGVNAVRAASAKINGEEYNNDFTNPLSSYLEQVQDNIKEEWAIYRKDPNATFNLSDFGWWADNFVSVASTASMLLPTIGISKGLSLLGRGIRVAGKTNKIAKSLSNIGDAVSANTMGVKLAEKYGNKFKFLSDAGKTRDTLLNGREIVQNAFMSRTMEGYLEARGVYRDVYDNALNRINNFTPEQQEEFLKNNPNLVGKSNEEIAHYIAGNSAEETFKQDYWMLLMDIVQFRALGELAKTGRKVSNANLELKALKERNKLLGITKQGTRPEWVDDNIFRLKYMAKHPFDGMFAEMWSEGFEEGFQGVQTEKGKEVAEKIFDPTFTPRELSSYLSDPAIYEQAFWGAIGSIGFSGIAKGLKHISNKIERADAVRNFLYDESTVAFLKLAEQKARKEGVEGWADSVNGFIKNINLVREGKDIDNVKRKEDGTVEYGELTEQQKKYKIDRMINDFLTDMALNADDRGNFDLFKEFITNKEVAAYINQQTGEESSAEAYLQKLQQKLFEVSDMYAKETYKLRTAVNVENPYVGRKIAREAVRTRLNMNDLNGELNNVESEINDLTENDGTYGAWEEKILSKYVRNKLDDINNEEKRHLREYADNKISKQAYDEYVDTLNRRRKALLEYANERILGISQDEEFRNLFSALQRESNIEINTSSLDDILRKFDEITSQIQLTDPVTPTPHLQQLAVKKAALSYNLKLVESQLPKTVNDYKREYKHHEMLIDKIARTRYNNAVDNILDWIEKQPDLNEAKRQLYNNEVDNLREDLDLIKIGHVNTREFWSAIDFALKSEEEKRQIEEQRKNTISVDGQQVNEEQGQQIRSQIEEEKQEETPPPSTGQETQTIPNAPTVPNTPAQPVPQPTPTIPAVPVPTPINPTPAIPTPTIPVVPIPKPAAPVRPNISPIEAQLLDEEARDYGNNEINKGRERAVAIVKDMALSNKDRFNNLTLDNIDEVNEIIQQVAEKLSIESNLDNEVCTSLASSALKYRIQLFQKRQQKKGNPTEKLEELIGYIALQEKYSAVGEYESVDTIEEQKNVINDFLDEYCKVRNIKKDTNGRAIINLIDVYNQAANNKEIPTIAVLQFFTNLHRFLSDTNKRDMLNYKFLNINTFNRLLADPVRLRETLNDIKNREDWDAKYMHVALSRSNKEAAEVVRKIDENSEIFATYSPTTRNGTKSRSIPFYYNGEEIGYLATVTANETNDAFTFDKNEGFVYTVRKFIGADSYEHYRVNEELELFIDELTDQNNPKYQWFRDIFSSDNITIKDFQTIYNSGIIQSLVDKGVLKIPSEYKTDREKAEYFYNELYNLLFYNKSDAANWNDRYDSWTAWRNKLYKNAVFTHNLMVSHNSKIRFVNTWDGKVRFSETEQWECGDKRYNFDAKKNPIVGVHLSGNIIIEGRTNEVANPAGFAMGTMGFLLRYSESGPAIAMITDSKTIAEHEHFNKLINNELTNLFSRFVNQDNYEYPDLVSDLEQLFSGPNIKNAPQVLFRGLSVIKNESGSMSLGYKDADGNYRYVLKINRYKYGTKEEKFDIRWFKDGIEEEIKIDKSNINKLTDAVQNITQFLKFNTSYLTLLNVNAKSKFNTKFYSINAAGGITITLGGEVLNYDSFTDFALKENVFYTNQEVGEDGSFFYNDANNSLFVDAEGAILPQSEKSNAVPIQDYKKLSINDEVAINNLLDSADIDKDIQNFLLGQNNFGINLVPDSVYISSSLKKVFAKVSKGKVLLSHSFLDNAVDKKTFIRILTHEKIHIEFSKLNDIEKQRIINELSKTYTAFINAVKNDLQSTDEKVRRIAEGLNQWIENEGFTPEKYGLNLDDYNKKKYYNSTKEEQLVWFMEEWLAESITQQDLREYLNSVDYGTAIVGQPQTILAKMLKLLLQIFGKNPSIITKDIKNNTILATQFNILNGQPIVDNQTNITTETSTSTETKINTDTIAENEIDESNVEKEDNEETQTPIENDTKIEEINKDYTNIEDAIDEEDPNNMFKPDEGFTEDIEDDIENDYGEDDEMAAATSTINVESNLDAELEQYTKDMKVNPNGFTNVTDMTEYLSKFNEEDRAAIQEALDNGTIQYVCY